MTTKRLTAAQWDFLTRTLAAEQRDDTHTPPFGSRAAGRAAANWWRTGDLLERLGLVRRDRSAFFLTDEGRKRLSEGNAPAKKAPAHTNPAYVIQRVKTLFKAQGWPISKTTGRYHPFANEQRTSEGYRVSKLGCSKTVAIAYSFGEADHQYNPAHKALRQEKMEAARKLLSDLGYRLDTNGWIECDGKDEWD